MTVVSKETGRILSLTNERTINGVKYIVTSHFKETGETAEDVLLRLVKDRVVDAIKHPDKYK